MMCRMVILSRQFTVMSLRGLWLSIDRAFSAQTQVLLSFRPLVRALARVLLF
jgi:hypothetical protein